MKEISIVLKMLDHGKWITVSRNAAHSFIISSYFLLLSASNYVIQPKWHYASMFNGTSINGWVNRKRRN
uniref:Uncharacterized protein n=1 Tax=Glossina palpalis gambiensis TaxID=67801 RepID=A0A1B0BNI8_9MUSC